MREYRYEQKYIMTKSAAEILKKRLLTIMDVDALGSSEGYTISSLYFDDPKSTAYYEKLNGVLFRTKYRIRIYNDKDNFIRLERKLKHNNMTSKDQTKISKKGYYDILNGHFDKLLLSKDQLLKEFIKDMKIKNLKPSVIVKYERLALTYPISDIRITFDSNVRSGLYNYDLFDSTLPTVEVLNPETVILEVKFNTVLPDSLAIILASVPSYRQAVSKFALCRAIK